MSDREVRNILEENKRHNAILFSEYDPLTGVGSPIERVRLTLTRDGRHIYIPKYIASASAFDTMLQHPTLEDYIEEHKIGRASCRERVSACV